MKCIKNERTLNQKLIKIIPVLKHKYFNIFLIGQCISFTGNWMQKAALQWIAYQITNSPFILGMIGVFQFTPTLLLSLFAGVFADRFPKKNFLIITQTIQMIQAFLLVFLIFSGNIRYWHIFILVFIQGVVTAFETPARHSFHIELVDKEDIIGAVGLNWTAANIARIIGPVLAGVFLTFWGTEICFLVNGISFIAVIISLCAIKSYDANIRIRDEKNILYEIFNGFKYIFLQRNLSEAILAMLIIGILVMNVDIIMPVFAKQVLGQGAAGYSLLFSAIGIGSLTSSLVFMIKGKELTKRRNFFISGMLLCLTLFSLSFVRNYYVALAVLSLIGVFQNTFITIVNSTIQLYSNDEFRGRAMSVYSLVLTGTSPVGNFLTGLVMQNYGSQFVFLFGGASAVLLLLPVAFYRHNIKGVFYESLEGISLRIFRNTSVEKRNKHDYL